MSEPLKLALGLMAAAVSALGYGLLAARFTKPDDSQPDNNLAADGVIGIAILTALFMTGHFFMPLRQTVNLVILLPGAVCFAVFFRRRFLLELPILGVMIWWAFQLSRSGPPAWDHGLYHVQSMVWNNLEPAIAGLANLHTRLGFNSSVFVLAAGLNIPLFGGWHLALVSPTLIEAMIATDLLLSIRSSPEKVARLYCLIAVAFLLFAPRWLVLLSYISPDSVIVMGILYVILLYLEKRRVALLLFLPFLITVKLSAAPLLLLLGWDRSLKKYKIAAVIGMLFLCIWVARNVVLSGHLLFPVSATRLPVPWAVPKDETQNTADWITSWARAPGKAIKDTRGLDWIRPWLNRTYENDQARTAFEIFCIGIFLLICSKGLRQVDFRLMSVITLALLFWFISAPDPRFGFGFMFAAAFLMLAYGLYSINLVRLESSNTWIVITVLMVGLSRMASAEHNLEWPKMIPSTLRLAFTPASDRIWAPVPPDDRCYALVPCSPEPENIRYYPERAIQRAPTR